MKWTKIRQKHPVKPLDRSLFIEFGSVAIFNKWL